MSRVSDARKRRAAISAWFRWLPLLLIPFSVLFSETWLQIQVFRHDYTMHSLTVELKQLQERIKSVKNKEASMKRLDRLEAEAPDLGLVEPQANQIVILRADASPTTPPDGAATQLAKETSEFRPAQTADGHTN